MTYRFTILGCGSSPGVPRPNGDWGACDPSEPRNSRTRAALMIERMGEGGTTRVVIDTGPDFRAQCIANGVDRIDAIVITHAHADHVHGIDDVRTFVLVSRKRMPVWADAATYRRLLEGFGYCFEKPAGSDYPPICEHRPIEDGRAFAIEGPGGPIELRPVPQRHASLATLGFRIGDFAYCPDVSAFPEGSLDLLRGLQCLVVDALQYRSHPSHFSVSEALAVINELRPARAILTHMHTPLDYRTLAAELPRGVEPAYDGLRIELEA